MNRFMTIANPFTRAWHDFHGFICGVVGLALSWWLLMHDYTKVKVSQKSADGTASGIFLRGVHAAQRDGWAGFLGVLLLLLALAFIWRAARSMDRQSDVTRFFVLLGAICVGAFAGTWLYRTVKAKDFDVVSFRWGMAACFAVIVLLLVNLVYYDDCEV